MAQSTIKTNVSRYSITVSTNSEGTIFVAALDNKIVFSAECNNYLVVHMMTYLENGTRRHFFKVLDFVTLQPITWTSVGLRIYYI